MNNKLQNLRRILSGMKSALVAFSGGIDSTFLLQTAHDVLKNNIIAVTAQSETYPAIELQNAKKIVEKIGVRHIVISTDELKDHRFTGNPADRCYWCKKELFSKLDKIAKENKLNYVLDGSNYDDINDYRPGNKAKKEFAVRSPLQEAGLTKDEIRKISKEMGIENWDKPSLACLASRIPYGTKITEKNLQVIDAGEEFIRSLGFKQVRIRHYGDTAKIEIESKDLKKVMDEHIREKIVHRIKGLGFKYITLDLEGYMTGSMNKVLQ